MSDSSRQSLLSSFTEHREALTRFLKQRLGNVALAEDLTQEIWLRAANSRGAPAIGNPRGYLFRIASNLALDHQRHAGHHIELEAEDTVIHAVADRQPSPENVVLYRSEFARLMRVVDGLPPRCREVFILCKIEELSYAEIAARLRISPNTVVTHMVHALAAVAREIPPEKN